MNLNGYVVGGISEALHSKKEKVDVKESEDEVLTTLFSFKPPVSTEESADVNTTIVSRCYRFEILFFSAMKIYCIVVEIFIQPCIFLTEIFHSSFFRMKKLSNNI